MSLRDGIDRLYDECAATGSMPLDKLWVLVSMAYAVQDLVENGPEPEQDTYDYFRWADLREKLRRLGE